MKTAIQAPEPQPPEAPDRCLAEVAHIDSLTSPCTVCPQAIAGCQHQDYPAGCPFADK